MRLTWYILRLHIGPFIFGTCAVVFIFLLQFVFKFLNDLVGKGLSYGIIAKLIVYNFAWMLVLAVPMGVLVATLMAYGKLSGNNELTIVKSAGGSAFRAMFPAILGGAVLFLLLYLFNDRVLPEANQRAAVLQNDIKQLKPTFAVEAGQFTTLQGYSILARRVDKVHNELLDVTIYTQDVANDAMNVINAKRAEMQFNDDFSKLQMTFHDAEVQQINRKNLQSFRMLTFRTYQIALATNGYNFSRTDPSSMGRSDRSLNIDSMSGIVRRSQSASNLSAHRIDSLTAALAIVDTTHPAQVPGAVAQLQNIPPDTHGPISQTRKDSLVHTPALSKAAPKRSGKVTISGNRAPGNPTSRPNDTIPTLASTIPTTPGTPAVSTNATPRQKAATAALARLALLRPQIEAESDARSSELRTGNQYEVEIQKKYSIPAACFFFVFVGAPLGIVVRRGNFGVSAAIALGFFVIYWACLILGEKLADRLMLSPFTAMWMADAVIGVIGLFLTIRVSRETSAFISIAAIKRIFRRKTQITDPTPA